MKPRASLASSLLLAQWPVSPKRSWRDELV